MQSDAFTAGASQDRGRTVEELERELAEAHRREAATAGVIKVISRSAFDLPTVLNMLVESAARLCEADQAQIFRRKGSGYYSAARYGFSPEYLEFVKSFTFAPGRGSLVGRVQLEGKTVQIPDVLADPEYLLHEQQRLGGFRTHLGVPLLREGELIGVLMPSRTTVRPFTDKQVELLETFADQAVIAIENTRLFEAEQASKRELQESLEYQTATSDVLSVISRSPSQLRPVLNTIVETASRLCEAYDAVVLLSDGGMLKFAAHYGPIPIDFAEWPITREWTAGRAFVDRKAIHVHDLAIAEDEYPDGHAMSVRLGHRTILSTPLLRHHEPIGTITIRRTEVRPFADKQIALLQTFADQAVIAIENTRLFEEVQARTTELTESLEYQTAISNVLGVISASPNDVRPAYQNIVETACRLCKADRAGVWRLEDGRFNPVARANEKGPLDLLPGADTSPLDRSSLAGRVGLDRRTVHIPDIRADPDYDKFRSRPDDDRRSMLGVPLMRQGQVIGAIILIRTRLEPFSQAEIRLVETFADQAVIAIENTRLFEAEQASKRELTETLEFQTATSEVLGGISRSLTDVQPVLDTIAQTSQRLCQADRSSVWRLVEHVFELVAISDYSPAVADYMTRAPIPADRTSVAGRCVLEKRTIHVHDRLNEPGLPPLPQSYASRARTLLCVPLLREGEPIGVVRLSRDKVAPFTTRQIALVETFADQAVIAIENTRLLNDLRESLQQQTATSNVLGVISRSAFDLDPVFKTVAESAVRLCEADRAFIFRFDGELLRMAVGYNVTPEFEDWVRRNPIRPGRHSGSARAALERRTIHIPDVLADPEYSYGAKNVEAIRTILGVPILKGLELLGVMMIFKLEVSPFTEKQIALVETFADQAAIAIENTRLFNETKESLERQTAISEILRVISRSPTDIQPVLDAVAERAARICEARIADIFFATNDTINLTATFGDASRPTGEPVPLDRTTVMGRSIVDRQPVHVADLHNAADEFPLGQRLALRFGHRTILAVPLVRENHSLGTILVRRFEVRPFEDKHIALLTTFADQAAIAIENVRLFNEIVQKSRELEIASQHKSQFVANMSHELRTPLAAILGYAELMQEGFYGGLSEKSTDALTRIRSNGKHLLGLINTVLDIAKIESGQFSLNLAEYALSSVVETVRVATESLAETKKLALMTYVPKSLPIGFGDEQRLTQVLLNLVGNAIKFTDTGEVRITAKSENGHFAVSVADTGPGIPADQLTRVFEQFHQVDSSNTKAKGGTGLGLAIAKQIVEMHGGRVWVESEPGKGATFQMELPVRAEFRKSAP